MKRAAYALTLSCIGSTLAVSAGAQAIYAGVRVGAGVPTGSFSTEATATGDAALLRGAKAGPGYGFDAGLGASIVGLYASYDKVQFGCQSNSCASSGEYQLAGASAGARVGIPLLPLIKPWAKAGLTYMRMKGSASGSVVTTERRLGYETGAGVDIPILMGFFRLSPQVKMVRQKLEPVIASSSATTGAKRSANFFLFSLGLTVGSPF